MDRNFHRTTSPRLIPDRPAPDALTAGLPGLPASSPSGLPAPASSPGAHSISPSVCEANTLHSFSDGGQRVPNLSEISASTSIAELCQKFDALISTGLSLRQAARSLGKSPAWFSGEKSPYRQWKTGVTIPKATRGAKPTFTVPDWFVPAARFFYLLSNRTATSGSIPEAIRRTISLPDCPPAIKDRLAKVLAPYLPTVAADVSPLMNPAPCSPVSADVSRPPSPFSSVQSGLPTCPADLRETILARQRAGQSLVPTRLARQIAASEVLVKTYRHARNAQLDYTNAGPGSLMWYTDPESGERRFVQAGDAFEADDATINFPVCIPWTIGGDPCSDRYGVRVGRFQWLVSIDRASRFVPGYSYTARPRSSYRAEDVLRLMRHIGRAHGLPSTWVFEQGVWKSNLVKDAIRLMGCVLQTVYSPHSKAFIEGLFNILWTKLSLHFPDAHIGRSQGEQKAACDLLTSCQGGHRDPRNHFPMLHGAISAFDSALAEKHATPVHSENYGSWVPLERWQQQLSARPLRKLDPATDWAFSPCVSEWTIRGMLVGGRVKIFEDLSVPFDFSASWMQYYHGARVKCYYDPSAPRCAATVCLAESWPGGPQGDRAGDVLGTAEQVNDVAGYTRLVMGWGDDPAGRARLVRQQCAKAVRRELRATLGQPGARGLQVSESHDGIGTTTILEKDALTAGQDLRAREDARPHDITEDRLARAKQFELDHALDFIT